MRWRCPQYRDATALSTDHILATKLVIPTSPTQLVPRARLRQPDNEPAVILVCAPAGYGKTTLIATWASASRHKMACLLLDADDNKPLRFLTHFIGAILARFPGFGGQAGSFAAAARGWSDALAGELAVRFFAAPAAGSAAMN